MYSQRCPSTDAASQIKPTTKNTNPKPTPKNTNQAVDFAAKHDIPRAFGSYAELCADPEVEVVYIGTLHAFHKCVARGGFTIIWGGRRMDAALNDSRLGSTPVNQSYERSHTHKFNNQGPRPPGAGGGEARAGGEARGLHGGGRGGHRQGGKFVCVFV